LKAETFGAKEFIQGRDKRWIKAIFKTLDALPAGRNFIECRQDYMEFLQSCCPLYGSCFFFVEASQLYMYIIIKKCFSTVTNLKIIIIFWLLFWVFWESILLKDWQFVYWLILNANTPTWKWKHLVGWVVNWIAKHGSRNASTNVSSYQCKWCPFNWS
jgi:hypothetical protein